MADDILKDVNGGVNDFSKACLNSSLGENLWSIHQRTGRLNAFHCMESNMK